MPPGVRHVRGGHDGLRGWAAKESSWWPCSCPSRLDFPCLRRRGLVYHVRRCTCGLCGTLARFLAAADETRLEWPLAKDSRAHIHQILDAHNLPVTHTTRRAGRPFTLVLTKTDALFEREAKERELWEGDLRWLTKAAPAF